MGDLTPLVNAFLYKSMVFATIQENIIYRAWNGIAEAATHTCTCRAENNTSGLAGQNWRPL